MSHLHLVREGEPTRPADLVVEWRRHAAELGRYAPEAAAVFEDCAADLDRALATDGAELLTLTQAARVCGYSADHLGRLIKQGRIVNYGRRKAPRVRRSDLPRKATTLPTRPHPLQVAGASATQVARSLIQG